jgi:predicted ArsR family transcriptional regulator
MKPTTRFRILEYIRKYQVASVRELSVLVGTTGANIRHHLSLLESNDLIEIIGTQNEGRGRPRQVYGLSRRVLGDGLDNLSGNLLTLWIGDARSEVREASLKALAERLSGSIDPNFPIMRRITWTVASLNEFHYRARWEASSSGARIILGHCPYSAIIADHPELCRMDAFLLEGKLGAVVMQTAKLQLSDKGLPYCAFQMIANG